MFYLLENNMQNVLSVVNNWSYFSEPICPLLGPPRRRRTAWRGPNPAWDAEWDAGDEEFIPIPPLHLPSQKLPRKIKIEVRKNCCYFGNDGFELENNLTIT